MKCSILARCAVTALMFHPLSALASSNLLRNADFETAGSGQDRARYWQFGVPDQNGDVWGSASRENWRNYPTNVAGYVATLRGTWAGAGDYGGWWQQGDASAGLTYEASAWFWADSNAVSGIVWTSAVQELKIEFYQFLSSNYFLNGFVSTSFVGEVGEDWKQMIVRGVAPQGTVKARFVASMSGAANSGALVMDSAELRSITTRDQDFNDWTTQTNDGCYTRDDWTVCTGKTVNSFLSGTNIIPLARSGYAASLTSPGGGPAGGYIQSPELIEGIGIISFWYRNGALDSETEPTNAVALSVQKSVDGSTWQTIATVSNILSFSYLPFSMYFFDDSSFYVRIQHVGGTNRVIIDDVLVAPPQPFPRFQDFDSWPSTATNLGCHTYLGWNVCSGRVWSVNAFQGMSAFLSPSVNYTNAVTSPFFTNGYGTISFSYARGTNGSGPAHLALQASADGSSWTTLDGITNINSQSYASYSRFFFNSDPRYVRIANIVITNAGSGGVLVEESFIAGNVAPAGWTFNGVDQYTSDTSSGTNPPALQFNSTGDFIITPNLSNPTNLAFWMKGNTISPTSSFLIEVTSAGVWTTLANLTNISNTEVNRQFPISTTVTNIRFTYTKGSGNLAFDDVKILGAVAGPQPPQALQLDQITISPSLETRLQDFEAWPTKPNYQSGVSEFNGWSVDNTIIDDQNAFQGQVGRLNQANGSFVQSHFFPDGIGPISFQYRHWNGLAPAATLDVQISSNETTWVTITNLVISSSNYTEFSRYLFVTNGSAVRFFHSAGAERILLDDINIGRPQPPADIVFNGTSIEPQYPYIHDGVTVLANISALYSANSLMVTTYYRNGTSGVFAPLAMNQADLVNYGTVDFIPPQTNGSLIQYYFRSTFSGPAANSNSPKFYPAGAPTNLLSYRIPRTKPGQVWINEVVYNTIDPFVQFIELCGPAAFNMSDWQLLLLNGKDVTPKPIGSYDIPTSTFLPNDTVGFGFFLFDGGTHIPYDMLLTNDMSTQFPLGIRLLNEAGGIEYALSVGGGVTTFDFIPATTPDDDFFGETSIQLAGTGGEYTAFTWTWTNPPTPGEINVAQVLTNLPVTPPDVDLVRLTAGTNVTLYAFGNTNEWNVAPYYTTNVGATQQLWQAVSQYIVAVVGQTNVVSFGAPSPGLNFIYRLLITEP